jgi:uncharacterized membrane protein
MSGRLQFVGRRLVRRLARLFVRRCGLVLGHSQGERGVIAVLSAILLTVIVTSGALSLDIAGRVTEVRRDQATADLAALDAVRNLLSAQTVATASARRNGVDNTKSGNSVVATLGEISVVNGRNVFSAGRSQTAVQVKVSTPYKDFLGGTKGSMVATASASNVGMAGFSVGATLIDINTGLGKFGGANLALVGYKGLASGTVTLGALATKLGLSLLTPDQVLASNVTVAQVVNASALLLSATDPSYASLTALGTALAGNPLNNLNGVALGSVLGLQQGAGVGLGATVNLLQALTGTVQLATQKAGLAANLVLTLPLNVASVSAGVTAIVPPTIVYGPLGTTATNTQVTVNMAVDLNIGGVGLLGLSIANAHLPITLTLGGAIGTLKAITCANATPTSITLGTAFPTLTLNVSGGSVTLLGIPLATNILGPITIISNGVADAILAYPANFSSNPVANLAVRVLSSLGSTGIANLTGSGLIGSLLATVLNVVGTAIVPLVASIVSVLTSTLGITLGSADYVGIRPSDPVCAAPRLAG